MIHLLDVNVLIALIDTKHVDHAMAHDWFDHVSSDGWATCPLTQNGVIRIVGHSSYPNSPGAPAIVAETVAAALRWPGHEFWPDDVSLLTDAGIDRRRLLRSKQITDTYLLALAVKHGGRLATLDRRLATDAVSGGREALVVL
ncbi:toxin-antitoxin system PIN domain toxin [Methylopila capsulata]|uniref:Ribonuclease VapC n=1 Tax=Methylopila capsulata TaxID=61654 RepID=A0A9W6IRK5_9HYPH|nr:TA system VapC family ribonuclease toxin [Methylopila capsulata]MBM7851814.1 toxin-antitoxin system PIN domain toxin [Methylopila capsulata]GLK54878.1 DNA-binding protein [Methylopila capsulata]